MAQHDELSAESILRGVDLSSSSLHPMAGLGGIDYIYLDDPSSSGGALPSRGWSDDLCYGTGTIYLSGLVTGGASGFVQGLRQTRDISSFKLRLNGVLNSITRRGPFVGNSAGVVTLLYHCTNGIVGALRGGKRDMYSSIGAAGFAGLMFRATSGVKASVFAATVCMGIATVWNVGQSRWRSIPELLGKRHAL
jgi:import inner membrane translocase subunit TIM23